MTWYQTKTKVLPAAVMFHVVMTTQKSTHTHTHTHMTSIHTQHTHKLTSCNHCDGEVVATDPTPRTPVGATNCTCSEYG